MSNLNFYHGSPYGGLKHTSEYEANILFLTTSEIVAEHYTKILVTSGRITKLNQKKALAFRPGMNFGLGFQCMP